MKKVRICFMVFIGIVLSFGNAVIGWADYQKTYTVVDKCTISTPCINVRGDSNTTFEVKYTTPIGAEVGNTVTVLFNDDGKPKKITNDQTGHTAQIVSWN